MNPGDFLHSIWSVVAALLGTCGVLVGVILTLWNSRKQLRMQLEQQARESKVAREMELRRDVYMEASVAIARATSALLQLADLTRNSSELASQFATDVAAIGKVHVVAGGATIDAVMEFTRELGSARAALNLVHMRILARQLRLDDAECGTGQRESLLAEQQRDKLELAELGIAWARKVASYVPATVIAIRRELDLPLDERVYQESFNRSWAQNEATAREFLARIREQRP
jgi:hypothetical protein